MTLNQTITNTLGGGHIPPPMTGLFVRFFHKEGGKIDDAKDIFQDALVILIEKIYKDNLNIKKSIGGYLYVICENLWKYNQREFFIILYN
jgi:hypothetical protein